MLPATRPPQHKSATPSYLNVANRLVYLRAAASIAARIVEGDVSWPKVRLAPLRTVFPIPVEIHLPIQQSTSQQSMCQNTYGVQSIFQI